VRRAERAERGASHQSGAEINPPPKDLE
jgi:hypothetical protein